MFPMKLKVCLRPSRQRLWPELQIRLRFDIWMTFSFHDFHLLPHLNYRRCSPGSVCCRLCGPYTLST
jgi:hypothetical protein